MSQPVDHHLFTQILKEHVDDKGMVDYRALQADSVQLNKYLSLLESHHPNETHWSESEQLAYWINAYNAFTLRLIIRHYPIESIKDITLVSIPFVSSPWDLKFIQIENATYDLNHIEHTIIRKRFHEPRIHFALVCAAVSCPKLRREAYAANELEEQLQAQALDFINDTSKNEIIGSSLTLSKIFWWYGGDFKENGSVAEYVNQFTQTEVSSGASIDHLDYNWSLNDQSKE